MVGISSTSSKGSLAVNDGPLLPDIVSHLRQSNPKQPLEVLRQRYEEDGYLFLKGLLPRADVLWARTKYSEMMAPTGVLKEGTAPTEGSSMTRRPQRISLASVPALVLTAKGRRRLWIWRSPLIVSNGTPRSSASTQHFWISYRNSQAGTRIYCPFGDRP